MGIANLRAGTDRLQDVYNVATAADAALHALWRDLNMAPGEERRIEEYLLIRPASFVPYISRVDGSGGQRLPTPNASSSPETRANAAIEDIAADLRKASWRVWEEYRDAVT